MIREYFNAFTSKVETSLGKCDVGFYPPFTLLGPLSNHFKTLELESYFHVGAQNAHEAENGAFTGEVSVAMLKEEAIRHVILGHSERRQYFGETSEKVAAKAKVCMEQAVVPIVCIGESRAARESGDTQKVLAAQLLPVLQAIPKNDRIIFAYEPVWAIGTGLAATAEMAEETHKFIRGVLVESFGEKIASKLRIVYGGSVKANNARDLFSMANIDGALVGGASLDPSQFAEIVLAAQEAP
jgi:triosephosphate isomerase